ncbi:hypothetical protein PoMZ_04060, partial [Pyricularia oryzae]
AGPVLATLLPYTNTRRNPSPQTGWPYCVYYSPATLPLIPSKQASKQPRSPRSILRGPSLKTFAIIDMGAWVGGAPRPRMSRTWKHTPAAWQGGAKGLNFKPPCRHPAKMGGRAGTHTKRKNPTATLWWESGLGIRSGPGFPALALAWMSMSLFLVTVPIPVPVFGQVRNGAFIFF